MDYTPYECGRSGLGGRQAQILDVGSVLFASLENAAPIALFNARAGGPSAIRKRISTQPRSTTCFMLARLRSAFRRSWPTLRQEWRESMAYVVGVLIQRILGLFHDSSFWRRCGMPSTPSLQR